MTLDRDRLVDWAMTFVAAILAATLLGAQGGPSGEGGLALVRELELDFKLMDAEAALPPEVREVIGLAGDAEEDRARCRAALERHVERLRDAPAMLVVVTSIAVAHHEDGLALETLDVLAEAPEAMSRWALLVDELHRMARGAPAASPDSMQAAALELGASPWLRERLRARHLTNGGGDGASSARDAARGLAVTFVERFTGLMVLWITLGIIGTLLLLFWPLVRRALLGAGYVGLSSLKSPFIIPSTHRVMIAWFLTFILVGLGMTGLASLSGGAAQGQALNLAVQTLVQGGVAIWLIQRFGRPRDDQLPLGVPLRLAIGPGVGGAAGVALWTVGGLAIGLVVVTSVSIVGAALTGGPDDSQRALELFADPGGLETRVIIGLSAVLFAPVFEEILFRGFLYRNLRDLLGAGPAMAASGLLFGCAHLDPSLILPLAALGTVLAFLFERSGSLAVPIIVHATWNLGQLIFAVVLGAG